MKLKADVCACAVQATGWLEVEVVYPPEKEKLLHSKKNGQGPAITARTLYPLLLDSLTPSAVPSYAPPVLCLSMSFHTSPRFSSICLAVQRSMQRTVCGLLSLMNWRQNSDVMCTGRIHRHRLQGPEHHCWDQGSCRCQQLNAAQLRQRTCASLQVQDKGNNLRSVMLGSGRGTE